ncbi:ribosome small subunit-dependent GTPase A [Agrococcus casei]|uniref:Small ribosomal subunit biogenesis GTPase RsgA n=1 Tax=Agrococcus casei LMG 22410 TaxID=1255656 RepID=A0A1R4FKU2_9MICO|nr:ribosome small subunit-dependent GTPase A [Agrococcus casei]SJM56463.1 Ribosome small subunit-stimulated GTPase EngC [Agrococcus casei LMG 22410]
MSWLSDYDDPYERYDESLIRERPNPKANRPRTKQRPEHGDAHDGFVTSVDRGRYSVVIDEGGAQERSITCTRARELRKEAIVAGDRVDVVGDVSGNEGTLARIVRIQPRTTLLRRSADDSDEFERVIVANADTMLMVTAAADPEPRPRLIHRYLVAAYDAGVTPIMVVTKTDLADPQPLLAHFEGFGIETFFSTPDAPPVEALGKRLEGRISVAVGHSGVGKSTLVNALVPDAKRATGHVNAVTGRGRHTSSSTASYRIGGGWIIDTPGVRSFGLGHVDTASIIAAFPALAEVAATCPRGCTHLADAPDCAMAEAAEAGSLDSRLVSSMQSMLETLVTARQGRFDF